MQVGGWQRYVVVGDAYITNLMSPDIYVGGEQLAMV
jgi:hypothetical protein